MSKLRNKALESLPSSTISQMNLFRRKFLIGAGIVGAAAAIGSRLVVNPQKASAAVASPFTDIDILNFALNLEYLEAEFYLHATTGSGLASSEVSGTGTLGEVKGGAQVPFTSDVVRALADGLAADEHNHVLLLRAALGDSAVARPEININRAFTKAAIAAGIINSNETFNAYANDANFLLASFIFEDVGVTAYHGAAPFISSPQYLSTAAGILAVEAYHAGAIRYSLFNLGQTMSSVITDANAISAVRAQADGMDPNGHDTPLTNTDGSFNVIAGDPSNSVAYARTFDEVLRVVYLGNRADTEGGFFPAGVNGVIR